MENLLVMTWRSHPAREHPLKLALAVLAMGVVAFGSLFFTGSTFVALAMLLGLWLTTFEFFVPTEYRIDPSGVSMSRPGSSRHRRWSDVRRVAPERNGLLLSPFENRRRLLDERRGIYLRYADNGDDVRKLVGAYLNARNPEALG